MRYLNRHEERSDKLVVLRRCKAKSDWVSRIYCWIDNNNGDQFEASIMSGVDGQKVPVLVEHLNHKHGHDYKKKLMTFKTEPSFVNYACS
jgi:hypothetical protein